MTEPYYFLPNEEYYPLFEDRLKYILDDRRNKVYLATSDGTFNSDDCSITNHPCPYEYETSRKVIGWLIYSKDKIWGLYVSPLYRKRGIAKKMLKLAFFYEKQWPSEVELYYPVKGLHRFLVSEFNRIPPGGVSKNARIYVKDILYKK